MEKGVAHQTRAKKNQRAERIINDRFSETMLAKIFDYAAAVVELYPFKGFDEMWLTLCLVARRWRAGVAKKFFCELRKHALQLKESSSLISVLYIREAREATFWIDLAKCQAAGLGLAECKFGAIALGNHLTKVMINKPKLRINNSTTLNDGLEKALLTIPSKDIQRITLDSNGTYPIPPSILSDDMWKHLDHGADFAGFPRGPEIWMDQSANWHYAMTNAEVDQWVNIFGKCSKMLVFVPTDDPWKVENCLHKRFGLLTPLKESAARWNLEVRSLTNPGK
jgi:hypothetical protein